LERDDSCRVCGSKESLDVHHRTYRYRGEERMEDLITLCRPCHELFHKNGKTDEPLLVSTTPGGDP
jgi:5-methylcytosine-specific restriction endonuclease McrA